MEIIGILFVILIVFGLPVAAIVIAGMARSRIEAAAKGVEFLTREHAVVVEEVMALRKRLRQLEEGQGAAPMSAEAVAPPEEATPSQAAEAAIPPVAPGETLPPDTAGVGAMASGPVMPDEEETALPAAARRPAADLESRIGGRWSVILGGLATALGAVLLVRVSIEAGLLGPAQRVGLGILLALVLLGAGEWLRRRDRQVQLPVLPKADIPSVLTAAGVVAAFASAYAAYALYGFVGPAAAFIILTVVGLAALALSAVHGPGLAALGAVGSYGTPLLVSTQEPDLLALAGHVVVVTASVAGIAALRSWLWLAWCGVAGSTAWIVLAALTSGAGAGFAGLAMLVGTAIIWLATFGLAQHGRPGVVADTGTDRAAMVAFGAVVAGFFVQAAINLAFPLPLAAFACSLILAAGALAWPGLAPTALGAAAITLFGLAALDLRLAYDASAFTIEEFRSGVAPADPSAFIRNGMIGSLPAIAVLAAGAWRAARVAPGFAGWLAWGSVTAASLGLFIAYMRIAPFESHRMFGATGLALAFVLALACEAFIRLRPEDMRAHAPAAFAVGSVATLAFGVAVSVDVGWLPLAFALTAFGIAIIHGFRPLAVLPWLAAVAGAIALLSIMASLPYAPDEIGRTIFFNRLLILLGLPSLVLIAAGEIFRRRGVNIAASIASAEGLALAGLFTAAQIRHWLTGGEVVAQAGTGLAEMASYSLASLGFALGLQRVATLTRARIYANATLVAGVIGALFIAGGLLLFHNPLFTDIAVGTGRIFNALFPAYLLTGVAAALVALQARPIRPRAYVLAFAGLGGLLLFTWVSLSVRHHFQGEQIGIDRVTGDSEFWSYSVAWMVLGILLLIAGHGLRSVPIRAASGILIVLTICKVFIFDMAALTGALRAFSFLGLGLCLIAIGRFYQRLLMSGTRQDREPPENGPPPADQPA